MALVWLVRDKRGHEIVLTEDTWYNHIEVNHQQLRGHDACVAKAITNPYRIMADAAHPSRQNYYRPRTHPDYPDLFVKVCVEFRSEVLDLLGTMNGTVVTAFLTDRIRADEVQLWPKR